MNKIYFSEDTIAAPATTFGGAIGIIRMSGPKSFEVLSQLTHSKLGKTIEPKKFYRALLYSHQGNQLDDAMVVSFMKPKSYTGEDLIEFHIHGSSFIAHSLLEALRYYHVRPALAGEFSFRAVRNNKMTLYQAQSVMDLISSSNEHALELALEKFSGQQNDALNQLGANLRRLLSLAEVGIDFSDQNLPDISLTSLQSTTNLILQELQAIEQTFHQGQCIQEGVKVSILGLPNAGKSTFFNALLNEERSIISEIAGTTRDVVSEKVTLSSRGQTITFRLEDTAGFRNTTHSIEKIGIEKSQKSAEQADLILFLVDPNDSMEKAIEEWKMLHFSSFTKKTIGLLTKMDQVSQDQEKIAKNYLRQLNILEWVPISAQTQQGILEVISKMIFFSEKWTHRKPGEIILTRPIQLHAVKKAMEALKRAQEAFAIELFASDIRQATDALSPLIGSTEIDDILNQIFSEFCIGK